VIGIFIFIAVVSCITGFYIYHLNSKLMQNSLNMKHINTISSRSFLKQVVYSLRLMKKENVVYLINAGYAYSLSGDDKKLLNI